MGSLVVQWFLGVIFYCKKSLSKISVALNYLIHLVDNKTYTTIQNVLFSYTYNNNPSKGNFLFSSEKAIGKNPERVKKYVKTNHLGNVHVVITDKKIPHYTATVLDFYQADVQSATDYYAFGSPMPGRKFQSATPYRYGFNGQEKDDEISGSGNSNTAEFWQYDTRLGRRWNRDTKPTTDVSPYVAFANNPINFSDEYGDTIRLRLLQQYFPDFTNKLVEKFSNYSGLNLSINENGDLTYEKDENGKPIIRTNFEANRSSIDEIEMNGSSGTYTQAGSKAARKLLMGGVNSKRTVEFEYYRGNNAYYDPTTSKISIGKEFTNKILASATGIHDTRVVDAGMVGLHELYHWWSGKGDGAQNLLKGPTVRYINKIERQLGFDVRAGYSKAVNGKVYIPYNREAKRYLRLGLEPASGKYIFVH